MQKQDVLIRAPQYVHDFDDVIGCGAVVNILEMIEVGQVCRNTDLHVSTPTCFTTLFINYCQQSKEDDLLC